MGILRLVAGGALGYIAYRAWQRRKAEEAATDAEWVDDEARTPPHGDPLAGTAAYDPDPNPRRNAADAA